MARSALSRRRGTKRTGRNWIPIIIGGMVLLIFGLAGGLMVGFMAFGGTKGVPRVNEVAGALKRNLRKNHGGDTLNHPANEKTKQMNHGGAVHTTRGAGWSPDYLDDGVGKTDENGWTEAKQKFLGHTVQIGTSGAFPYYPKTSVTEDHDFTTWTAPGGKRFQEYTNGDSPYTFAPNESDALARTRRYHVKKAMEHAWGGYETYAFGQDELLPISKKSNRKWGGLGTTLVDSLDTLWLMDMKEEFYRARDWCKTSLNHDKKQKVSVFETTIRSLGGLLSAYDWSQDEVFLDQAKDLGTRLFKSFDTKTGIPAGQVDLDSGSHENLSWMTSSALLAEAGTLQLEFRALARFSGNNDFKTKSEHVFDLLKDMEGTTDGLYPYAIRNYGDKPSAGNDKLTFGAMSDSFYEYMLKIWLQGGQTEQMYRDMYDRSIDGMHKHLLSVSSPSGLVFIADKNNGQMNYKMDHLVCFMGGLLALGAYTDPQGLDSERAQRDLKTAKALTYTCYQMYARMPTGISPEYIQVYKDKDFDVGPGAPHYLLRPETVESFFVLYHLTGDPIYREWGWEVFQAIERYCKTEAGYGQLTDVRKTHYPPQDKMESFFLAETLKYLYLLFDPETPIDLLHKHVFNTEAHPMRIFPAMDHDGVMDLLKQ